jgi:protein regulator of cytokinesis 1
VLRDVYKLAGGGSASPSGALGIDLSDATLGGLQARIDALSTLKAQRAAHASELMIILTSLWEACGVPPDAPERAGLAKLMSGPLRLHARSLERCAAEVRRCEEAKVSQMLEIVNAKARWDGALVAREEQARNAPTRWFLPPPR